MLNGGAEIVREFALGRGGVDICVRYADRAYPLEVKLASPKARIQGLEQLERYMSACGSSEGWLVIFDRGKSKARTAGSAEGRSKGGFATRSDALKTARPKAGASRDRTSGEAMRLYCLKR